MKPSHLSCRYSRGNYLTTATHKRLSSPHINTSTTQCCHLAPIGPNFSKSHLFASGGNRSNRIALYHSVAIRDDDDNDSGRNTAEEGQQRRRQEENDMDKWMHHDDGNVSTEAIEKNNSNNHHEDAMQTPGIPSIYSKPDHISSDLSSHHSFSKGDNNDSNNNNNNNITDTSRLHEYFTSHLLKSMPLYHENNTATSSTNTLFTSLSTTHKISLFSSFFEKFPEFRYPSQKDKRYLVEILELSMGELREIMALARERLRYHSHHHQQLERLKRIGVDSRHQEQYEIENHPTEGSISTEQRNFLMDWCRKQGWLHHPENMNQTAGNVDEDTASSNNTHSNSPVAPTRTQLRYLIDNTNLSKAQVISVIKSLTQEPKSPISKDVKDTLMQWLQDNDFRKPTKSEKRHLCEQTHLTKEQLKQQIDYLRDPPGDITPQSKEIVRQWMMKHNFNNPSSKERNHLQALTQWSRKQLQFQIERMRRRKDRTTPQDRELVLLWLQKNNYRNPTKEEKLVLQQETGLTAKQLAKILWHHKEPPGKVTQESKEFIREWMTRNKMRSPSSVEKLELQKHTGLNQQQINIQLRYLKDGPPGVITKEAKSEIVEWVQQKEEGRDVVSLEELCSRVSLNRRQVHSQVQLIRKKRRTL